MLSFVDYCDRMQGFFPRYNYEVIVFSKEWKNELEWALQSVLHYGYNEII